MDLDYFFRSSLQQTGKVLFNFTHSEYPCMAPNIMGHKILQHKKEVVFNLEATNSFSDHRVIFPKMKLQLIK